MLTAVRQSRIVAATIDRRKSYVTALFHDLIARAANRSTYGAAIAHQHTTCDSAELQANCRQFASRLIAPVLPIYCEWRMPTEVRAQLEPTRSESAS